MAGKRGRPKIEKKTGLTTKIKIFNKERVIEFVKNNPSLKKIFFSLFLVSLFSYLGLLPVGPLKLAEERHITVIGSYSSYENNNVASFIATVSNNNSVKETAVSETEKMSKNLIEAVMAFGVDPKDIKTTNNAVYETEKFEPAVAVNRATPQTESVKEWVATTSIEIKLKNINRAGELTALINSMGNVQIYGPNYYVDDELIDEGRMLTNAIDDAKEKAKFISRNHKKRLGDILSIEEMGETTSFPMGEVLGLGGDGDQFSPGTTKIVKKVKVRFVLK